MLLRVRVTSAVKLSNFQLKIFSKGWLALNIEKTNQNSKMNQEETNLEDYNIKTDDEGNIIIEESMVLVEKIC